MTVSADSRNNVLSGEGPRARGSSAFGIVTSLLFLALAGRLVQLQILEYDQLAGEAARQVYGTVYDRDRRGAIVDARGTTFAASVAIKSCAIDPKILLEAEGANPVKLLARLTEMLSLTPTDVQRINLGLEKRRSVDTDHGPVEEPVRFIWVKRRLDEREWEGLSSAMRSAKIEASNAWRNRRRWLRRVNERKVFRDSGGEAQAREAAEGWRKIALNAEGRFAGVFFPPEFERVYPQGSLAAHILGFGDIDGNGLEGVEKTFHALLQGVSVNRMVARDARASVLSTLAPDHRSTDGMTVELTVDSVVQAIVEEELRQGVDNLKRGSPEVTAHAVVIEPFSGDILAIANYPTFDPNRPGEFPARNRRNDAVVSVQEPGSTFKPLIISAAIEEKLANFMEEIDCTTFRMENGRIIRDIHPYGRMRLDMAVAKSSNPAMVRVGLRLSPKKMREYLLRYGFGEKTGSLLPGEIGGKVTDSGKWSSYTMGSVPMGYEINVTTLQMASAYSVIANGGVLMRPNIIRAVYDASGGLALVMQPEAKRRVISPETAALMRSVLRKVITEGTGRRADIKEYRLGGKTGTANMIVNEKERQAGMKGYSKVRHTANFVALAPWDKPRAVICVSIRETGKFGGEASSPVGAAIAKRILGYWGEPTMTGNAVGPEMASRKLSEPEAIPAIYTVGAPDDENALAEEVDPRIWEEWLEDDEALG
ncbi:MAG: penicillin-binding protein 2 [Planctomycetes bacterium]|nr:penicillin-binding protein 2 [Planctomycetota bacterium]